MKVDYFGCANGSKGHGWERPCAYRYHTHPIGGVDALYGPRVGEPPRDKRNDYRPEAPQGQAALLQLNGYTAIAYWDRSGDSRPNSNSMFAAEGEHTFDELLVEAKAQWPWVFERQTFEVTPVAKPPEDETPGETD